MTARIELNDWQMLAVQTAVRKAAEQNEINQADGINLAKLFESATQVWVVPNPSYDPE